MQEKKQNIRFFTSEFDKWPLKVHFFTRNLQKFRFLVKFGKNGQNLAKIGVLLKRGSFFLCIDPWNQFIQQFWYRKVFLLYWLCLSKRYIAKNAMWFMKNSEKMSNLNLLQCFIQLGFTMSAWVALFYYYYWHCSRYFLQQQRNIVRLNRLKISCLPFLLNGLSALERLVFPRKRSQAFLNQFLTLTLGLVRYLVQLQYQTLHLRR